MLVPSRMSAIDDGDKPTPAPNNFCKDFIRGCCVRENCRFLHESPPEPFLKVLFRFCHDFQNKGCYRSNCKFIHSSLEDEGHFYATGMFPRDSRNNHVCQAYIHGACNNRECKMIHPPDILGKEILPPPSTMPPPQYHRHHHMVREDDAPPEAKFRRYTYDEKDMENQVMSTNLCPNCESLEHKVKLLHENISVLLNKVGDLSEKNIQLTSMNEFLLEQSGSFRADQSCVITSRHGTSAPVSLATVSVTPVVSLAGGLPTLVPASATPNLTLAPAASRAQLLTSAPQLLTSAPQLLTVSTTQQLMGNSGALIVTSAGAQQLMQVSDSGTLMGGGQTVVAVTPAQLALAPTAPQLMTGASQSAVQQLVQQSAMQPQMAQHGPPQFATQQTVQHLAAQQNAQHLAAHQSAQHLEHLAAQQSAQHLAAQQSAQQLAAQQSAQQIVAQQSAQQMVAQQSAQQMVHQTSSQQITISSTSQPIALPNSQAQSITFPIISQSILHH